MNKNDVNMNATPETAESNEVMVINRADLAPADVNILKEATTQFFCSIPDDGSRENGIKIYNAINSKGKSLEETAGTVLDIVDVAAHPVSIVDPKTGEVINSLRTILIDKDGNIFDAVSEGVVSSLQKIFAIPGIGYPTYNPPLKLKLVKQKTRAGFYVNTIELV